MKIIFHKYNGNAIQTGDTANASDFAGMIFPYVGQSAPTGFLLCDGASFDNDTYPNLAAVMGGRYGVGTTVTFTADAGTDFITATGHGLSSGNLIVLQTTGTLPAGLSANTPYYLRDVTTNTFKLASSVGGAAINITDAGSGTHSYSNSSKVPDLRSRFPLGYSASAPTKTFTFSSRSGNTITVTGADNHAHNELQTGQAIFYDTTGSVMTGLTDATTYYVVRVAYNQIQLATSRANAIAGTVITLSSDGSGTQTFAITYTVRPMGQTGGEEDHSLTTTEIPSHVHALPEDNGNSGGMGLQSSSAPVTYNTNSQPAGGSEDHSTMPLFTVVNYIIKT